MFKMKFFIVLNKKMKSEARLPYLIVNEIINVIYL